MGHYETNDKRHYVCGKTRAKVAAKLAKAIAQRNVGLVFDSAHLTVTEYLDRWLVSI